LYLHQPYYKRRAVGRPAPWVDSGAQLDGLSSAGERPGLMAPVASSVDAGPAACQTAYYRAVGDRIGGRRATLSGPPGRAMPRMREILFAHRNNE